jgi:hypothetical protein
MTLAPLPVRSKVVEAVRLAVEALRVATSRRAFEANLAEHMPGDPELARAREQRDRLRAAALQLDGLKRMYQALSRGEWTGGPATPAPPAGVRKPPATSSGVSLARP